MDYLIVEDEYHAAKRLRSLIEKNVEKANCLDVIDSVEDAVEWFENNDDPDLTFFDIQLADGLSFSIFNKTRVESPVIFTTAFDEYALRAFKANSVDYLLKPVDEAELVSAIEKYKKLFGRKQPALDSDIVKSLMEKINSPEYIKRFLIKNGTSLSYVPTSEIAYFYSNDGLSFLVTKSNNKHNVDYTIEQLSELIDPEGFFRINRKLIVNVESVSKISDYFNSRLKLNLKPSFSDDVIVSRERVKQFKSWLTGVGQ